MAKVENWPSVSSGHITVGNPENSLAVVTLWTRREQITEILGPGNFAIAGQLYSKDGVSLALRNLFSNPNIRHLIVCGADLTETGESLVCLWQNGIDENHQVLGLEKARVHEEIPREALNRLRNEVSIYDFRNLEHQQMIQAIKELSQRLPRLSSRERSERYPLPEVKIGERMPAEPGAQIVRGKTVGETWLKVQQAVMRFGEDAYTNYQNRARDLSNLVAVVTDEDPDYPIIPDYLEFTEAEVKKYITEFLNPACPKGVFYTYGERIFAYGPHKINQGEIIVKKLRKDPNDRGAVAILYDPYHDNQLDVESPVDGFRNPCIVFLQAAIKYEKLELAAFFRSNDMFGAWPENAFGLRGFQKWIADRLEKYPLGPLTTCSMRAHTYEEPWSRLGTILEDRVNQTSWFEEDPRGNLTIEVDQNGQITLIHRNNDGRQLGPERVFDGERNRASVGIEKALTKDGVISRIDHALYVGRELMLAEIASKTGLSYEQDRSRIIQEITEIARKAKEYDKLKEQGLI